MFLKHIAMNIALAVILIFMLYESEAMPYKYSSYPSEDQQDYYLPYTEGRLSRLRRGYYYVGDGYVTRIPNPLAIAPIPLERRDLEIRRLDENAENIASKPVQKPKRKKLFVPNLYG